MSKTKKVISVVLAATLIMAMATVAMFSASAATTVYFENSENWAEVNCYTYVDGASDEGLGKWPGSPATLVEGNIWSMDVPENCTHIIFNAGSNGPQTNNLVNQGGGYIAKLSTGTEVGEYGETKTIYVWETYGDTPVETTAAPVETTVAPVETTVAPVETTVAPVETTVAPVETTAVVEPVETTAALVETTAVVEPVETTATPVETTAVVEPVETTVAPVETTAVVEPVETTAAPVETTAAVVEGGIFVDGTEFTAEAGSEITYVANLNTPNKIEDVQGYVTYDASKLTIVEAVTPNILGAIINTGEAGVVYFNATEVNNGMDFTTEAALIEIKFTVVDGTNTEIALTIEEMTERNGGSYFTDSEKVNADVTVAETLAVPEVTQPTETTEATVPTTTVVVEPTDATTTVVDPTKAPETNVTGGTDAPTENPDVPVTGSTVAIYAVLATLAMAAAAVVVLRKKVNG